MNQSEINSILTDMKNQAEVTRYENRTTGTSELGQDAFLQLMMTQLQYQDPMNPMDNSEMLNQQAQFTQIAELQKLNDTITQSNQLLHASSFIGQTVTLIDPENISETLEGKVTEAKIYKNGASIVIDGEEYPMGLILSVKETPEETTEET